VPLAGLPAKALTRGYHLLTIPANRARIAADWLLDALLPRQTVQLGLVRGSAVPLAAAAPTPATSATDRPPASASGGLRPAPGETPASAPRRAPGSEK
jgi:NADH dehydrogenase